MPTYRVTMIKTEDAIRKNLPGRIQEEIEIQARDPYSARNLLEAQHRGTYRAGSCFEVKK